MYVEGTIETLSPLTVGTELGRFRVAPKGPAEVGQTVLIRIRAEIALRKRT